MVDAGRQVRSESRSPCGPVRVERCSTHSMGDQHVTACQHAVEPQAALLRSWSASRACPTSRRTLLHAARQRDQPILNVAQPAAAARNVVQRGLGAGRVGEGRKGVCEREANTRHAAQCWRHVASETVARHLQGSFFSTLHNRPASDDSANHPALQAAPLTVSSPVESAGGLSRHRLSPVPGSSSARSKYSCAAPNNA